MGRESSSTTQDYSLIVFHHLEGFKYLGGHIITPVSGLLYYYVGSTKVLDFVGKRNE